MIRAQKIGMNDKTVNELIMGGYIESKELNSSIARKIAGIIWYEAERGDLVIQRESFENSEYKFYIKHKKIKK